MRHICRLTPLAILLAVSISCLDQRELLPTDAQLSSTQLELLDIAFASVSELPLTPHAKSRSRGQGRVVEATLKLGAPQRALRQLEQIADWRRQLGFAQYAFACARLGAEEEARKYALLAESHLETRETEIGQSWRIDRVRAKLAQTWLELGETERSESLAQGVAASELADLCAQRARLSPREEFAQRIQSAQEVLISGDLDAVKCALSACVSLYERDYADAGRRALAVAVVRDSWGKIPADITLDYLLRMAESTSVLGAPAEALPLLEEARLWRDSTHWVSEDRIKLNARLAELRIRAGEPEVGRTEIDAALAAYGAARDEIVNIYRTETLLPIAEALHALGDRPAALQVYARAIAEGLENPNGRPRAEALAACCLSLVLRNLEPDSELRMQIHNAHSLLGAPW